MLEHPICCDRIDMSKEYVSAKLPSLGDLKRKLIEEAKEVSSAADKSATIIELGDVLHAVDLIAANLGVSYGDIEEAAITKFSARCKNTSKILKGGINTTTFKSAWKASKTKET